jgi:hypothetical protein
MTSSLFELPIEPLNEITSLISARHIVRLIICGSTSFNEKLLNRGGVTIFRLDWINSSTDSWPRIFSRFTRLRCLKLKNHVNYGISGIIQPGLLSILPSSLQTLHISTFGSLVAFRTVFASNPDMFPNLTSLTLLGNNPNLNYGSNDVQQWPKTLTHLRTYWGHRFALELASLPENLTRLIGDYGDVLDPTQKFPLSLTHLQINIIQAWNPISSLPPGLTHCNFQNKYKVIQAEDIAQLPQGLRHFSSNAVDMASRQEILKNLPRSLTYLNIPSTLLEDDFPHLPSSLREIEGMLPDEIGPTIAKLLPSSLTTSYVEVHISALSYLPSSLEKLSLLRATSVELNQTLYELCPNPNMKIPLPLKEISLYKLTPKLASAIPDTLKTMFLERGDLEPECLIPLPQSITDFAISHRPAFSSDICLQLLPRNITSLDVASLGMKEIPYSLSLESSKWLPSGLTYLTIGPVSIESNDWFIGLPEKLKEMHIKTVASKISWKIQLPPSITLFAVRFQIISPGNAQNLIKSIHRNLKILEIASANEASDLTDEDLASIPKDSRLRKLSLPRCPGITERSQKVLSPLLKLSIETPPWTTAQK